LLPDSSIEGVQILPLNRFTDDRGWLAEICRADEWPAELAPAMCYVSITHPGVARGPHEHVDQSDVFCFPGPGTFDIRLWASSTGSATFGESMRLQAGTGVPAVLVIPPGVVNG